MGKFFILDCSNCNSEGGIQSALAVIYNISRDQGLLNVVKIIILSQRVDHVLPDYLRSFLQADRLLLIVHNGNLFQWFKNQMRIILSQCSNAVILFGPSYYFYFCKTLAGIANPFLLNRSALYQGLGTQRKILSIIRQKVKVKLLRSYTEYWVETDSLRSWIINEKWADPKNVYLYSNQLNPLFNVAETPVQFLSIKILVVTNGAHHKNDFAVADIVSYLRVLDPIVKISVHFTVNQNSSRARELSQQFYEKRINNLKVRFQNLRINDLGGAYSQCNIVLCPSRAEVFSATYIEALSAGRVIVAPKLNFVTEICKNAPMYYLDHDYKAAAQCIASILANKTEYLKRVRIGFSLAQEIKINQISRNQGLRNYILNN